MTAADRTRPPASETLTGTPSSKRIPGIGTLTICVTGALTILTADAWYSAAVAGNPSARWAPSFLYASVLCLWWTPIFFLQQAVGRRWPSFWQLSPKIILLQLVSAVALGRLHFLVLTLTFEFMMHRWPYLHRLKMHASQGESYFNAQRFGIEVLLYGLMWIAGCALNAQTARRRDALANAELKRQLSSAHLRALQMQMQPHFLFNTLNAITALVELGREKEAVATLSHLNAILKSTLVNEAPEKVTLAQELAVVENYLAIEQIRFADRLKITMSVDPGALDGMVPCFLLQPIVENAIRHGISRMEDNGIIQTRIERRGDILHLTVRDNGPGPQSQTRPNGHGIGLRNIQDRLAHFYSGNYSFRSGSPESGGFEVSITIPYESRSA